MYKEVLTNPQNHNPNNFIYIVHAINDGHISRNGVDELLISTKIKQMRTKRLFYCGSLIGKLDSETARRMFDRYRANSPISQIGTNGPIGLVLDIPNDDVIHITSRSDLGTHGEQKRFRKFVSQYQGETEDPLILLVMSEGMEGGSRRYNEIILSGHPLTSISGVFYQDTNSEAEAKGKLFGEMVSQLEEKEMPIIALPQPTFEGLIVMRGGGSLDDLVNMLRGNRTPT